MKKNNPSTQRSIVNPMLMVGIIVIPIFTLILLANYFWGIRPTHVFRDAREVMQAPFYVGLGSDLGIFLWVASASISLFTYFLLKKYARSVKIPQFFLFSALLSLLLLSDDWLRIHELLESEFGINEKIVFAIHALSLLLFLVFFRDEIVHSNYVILFIALGFFALSLIIDLPTVHFVGKIFVEDGAKVIGIATWMTYLSHTSRHFIDMELFPGQGKVSPTGGRVK